MEMQDKEFDQLFNSKLDGFEVEPSAQVWQNITGELDGKKAKRSIMPYLSIAASVIILASVSILFYNRSKEKEDQHPIKLVKVKPIREQSKPITNETPVMDNSITDDFQLNTATVANVPAKSQERKNTPAEQPKQETNTVAETTVQKTEPLLAAVPVEKPTILQLVPPGNNIGLNTATLVNRPNETNEIVEPTSFIIDPIAEKTPAKKRVRGLGGLINTVIAAVDKREDKLIEFTDAGDDEGSRVTGVNLGIFKIKKQ